MIFRPLVGALFLLFSLALAAAVAHADEAGEFARAWSEAGDSEPKKKEALDRLAEAKSVEAARILTSVALGPNEGVAIVDHVLRKLAELEGTPADAWMCAQLERAAGRWPERALLVRGIGRRATAEAGKLLRAALDDKAWQVAAAAIDELRRHASRETVEALLAAWGKLDPKKEESSRLGGDLRDTLLVLTGKDFQTSADAASWWSTNAASWKPPAKPGEVIEEREGVTGERTPRLFDEVRSRRVVLVIDTSASMRVETGAQRDPKKAPNGLSRFEVMRREVKRVIEGLPPNAAFTLITFGDKILPWKPALVTASEDKKRAAKRFIDGLLADGATNSYGALEQAFKVADADTIYFLSDGYPTVGKIDFNAILGDVRKWNATRNLKVHTIAFIAGNGKPLGIDEGDKSLPREFMRRLAQENGGRYKLVE